MTATFTFTDYCSQGQTLPYVIVDIASLPTGISIYMSCLVEEVLGCAQAQFQTLQGISQSSTGPRRQKIRKVM